MPIVLDYQLSPSLTPEHPGLDLPTASEMDLRYGCFLGAATFVVDAADFSARWARVPVLGFAWGIRSVIRGLVCGPEGVFEFTESNARIAFSREGNVVRIASNYTDATALAPYHELELEAERFLARVIREIEDRFPALAENPLVAALSRELAAPPYVPGNRDEAIELAKRHAEAIASGRADPFSMAQVMERYLTQHQWLDDDYRPRSVVRFVEGWSISGDRTDAEIRKYARLVVAGA